jgi:hypothetical protein
METLLMTMMMEVDMEAFKISPFSSCMVVMVEI